MMTDNGTNGNPLPDVNSRYTVIGMCITTIAVWIATAFGIDVPAEVATSTTTLIGLGLGLWKGDNRKERRATDKANGATSVP